MCAQNQQQLVCLVLSTNPAYSSVRVKCTVDCAIALLLAAAVVVDEKRSIAEFPLRTLVDLYSTKRCSDVIGEQRLVRMVRDGHSS